FILCLFRVCLSSFCFDIYIFFSYFVMTLFFFSSRRRHTRSKRDWSSDVLFRSETKVCYFYRTVIRNKNIFWLNVAMNKPNAMGSSDAATYREGEIPGFFHRHSACGTHDISQRMSFNKLHCKKGHVAVASQPHALVITINEGCVIEFGGGFGVGSKCCDNCGIFSHTRL